jgi:hypothetical protein
MDFSFSRVNIMNIITEKNSLNLLHKIAEEYHFELQHALQQIQINITANSYKSNMTVAELVTKKYFFENKIAFLEKRMKSAGVQFRPTT